MPPSVEAITTTRPAPRSTSKAAYSSRATSQPSSTYRRRTVRPAGPVCFVTRRLPSMARACARTSSREPASRTPPPPLPPGSPANRPAPRPPAWIWAFTTQRPPPIASAAAAASSTVNAGRPRGTAAP